MRRRQREDKRLQFLELVLVGICGGGGRGGVLEEGTRGSCGSKLELAMPTGTISPVTFFHSGKQYKKKVEEMTLFITFFCNEMSGEEAFLHADALSFPSSSPFQVAQPSRSPKIKEAFRNYSICSENINSGLCQNSTNKYCSTHFHYSIFSLIV